MLQLVLLILFLWVLQQEKANEYKYNINALGKLLAFGFAYFNLRIYTKHTLSV